MFFSEFTLYKKIIKILYNYVQNNCSFLCFYELKILKCIYIALFFFTCTWSIIHVENGVSNKYLTYKYIGGDYHILTLALSYSICNFSGQ